jgi:hypothetical protein
MPLFYKTPVKAKGVTEESVWGEFNRMKQRSIKSPEIFTEKL